MKQSKFLIAASGTGGHLIPAIQIAKELKKTVKDCEIVFVGSGRPLEEQLVGKAGYRRLVVPMVGIKRRGLRGIGEFLALLPQAVVKTIAILRRESPTVVVGVGGYASFFPVLCARLLGIPTWIHEAEMNPGLTNFVLSFFSSRVSVAFPGTKLAPFAKVVVTGQPVRAEVVAVGQNQQRSEKPRKILVLGGSQGARGIDLAMKEIAPRLGSGGFEVWHQCRPEIVAEMEEVYASCGVKAKVVSFIAEIAQAYQWSEIVISRSGAGSVAELATVGRPVIFVPLLSAAGGEQEANAQVLVQRGQAVVESESNSVGRGAGGQETFANRLWNRIEQLSNPERFQAMNRSGQAQTSISATEQIATGIISLGLR